MEEKKKKRRNLIAKKLKEDSYYHERVIPDKRKRTKMTVADLERDDFEQDELMEEQWKDLRESIRQKANEEDHSE